LDISWNHLYSTLFRRITSVHALEFVQFDLPFGIRIHPFRYNNSVRTIGKWAGYLLSNQRTNSLNASIKQDDAEKKSVVVCVPQSFNTTQNKIIGKEMNLMIVFGWVEFILIVAVFIFILIMWQVYWLEKRNLAVGFTFLTIGSAYFLILGISGLYGLLSFSDFSNILMFIMQLAVSLFVTGLGIYGLNSVYRNLRTVFGVLKKRRTKMD